jgi:hypothetical protein
MRFLFLFSAEKEEEALPLPLVPREGKEEAAAVGGARGSCRSCWEEMDAPLPISHT